VAEDLLHRYEIVEARDADKAISLAEARSPRMILAHGDLPDIAGAEIIRRVKAAVPSAWVVAPETDYHKPLREAAAKAGASASFSIWGIGDELLPTFKEILALEPSRSGAKTGVRI
jgi:DNA-binding NarL/FixJ family response regulator